MPSANMLRIRSIRSAAEIGGMGSWGMGFISSYSNPSPIRSKANL